MSSAAPLSRCTPGSHWPLIRQTPGGALGQGFEAKGIEVVTGARVQALERDSEQVIIRFTRGDPHVLGEYSAETVQVVATAMRAGMNVEQLAEMQFVFPTFTEAVSVAAQKVCRSVGVGRFPPAWVTLGCMNELELADRLHGVESVGPCAQVKFLLS